MSGSDDRLLVDRCIAQEPGAWRQFVDRFAPTARALARRYLKLQGYFPDEAELDDVLQEVFVAVTRRDFRLLRQYDPTYSFKTYLGVITRTQVHRMLRKRRAEPGPLDELDRPADGPSAVDRAQTNEEMDALGEAMEALPDRDREILTLRYLREMDYRSIAAALRIPEASVGQTLYRAKKRLLEGLKGLLGLLV